MAAAEAVFPLFLTHASSSKFFSSSKPSTALLSINFHNPCFTPLVCRNFPLFPLTNSHLTTRKLSFKRCSTTQELTAETELQQTQEETVQKRKLYVVNLPWSLSVADIKILFGQCGTVTDVEVIKQKNGRSRGFAFVTMASGEEAQAVVDKFDSHEISGRIIRVEYAKRFKKPSPPPPPGAPPKETRHKLYVSNIGWKVRANNLREFFSANNFTPVSSRVVFDSPTGRSSGYGFVSFVTREEAEAAISALDGKELMGRPLRLKFSENKPDESGSEKQDEENLEAQPEE
ncbi:hypothetical protein JCGZ_19129 [Jatropha curcas]|uniref:RRM domain-containing protein n=1 Tax=Jatropha curcas TaxID=180498 RepID=A0A067K0D0_JATCU|nr:28 kDa ribonucleoprotein, chloroplastic [Jatropha curcas]KDP29602.1 hypothetical protein JCGZ_19129 [Jatropha curcas]